LIGNGNGVANDSQATSFGIDGHLLFDWATDHGESHVHLVPNNEYALIGLSAAPYVTATGTNWIIADQAWATQSVDLYTTNGGDSLATLAIWYEEYDLNIDQVASDDV